MQAWRGHLGHSSLRLSTVLFVAILLMAACSSSTNDAGGDVEDETVETNASTNADPAAGNSEDEVEVEVLAEAEVPQVPGSPVNRFDLGVGECFNEASWFDEEIDRRIDLTASIDCSREHQSEVYFEVEFPAPASALFPGETAMAEWSTQQCYDAFEPFVGIDYEVSIYEIGIVQPTRDTFEHPVGLHRRVFCFVYDAAGSLLIDTARGSAS